MSSPSPTAPRRRLSAALAAFVVLAAAPSPTPRSTAAVPLPVVAAVSGGGETSLVVDLGASARIGKPGAVVTRNGVPEKADLLPLMSAGLNVAMVVDTSEAGASTLPAWLSAAARFILEAPGSTESVVITAGAPAKTVITAREGPLPIVGALNGLRAAGGRDTAAALRLASLEFPDARPGRRLVVLYTTADDAGDTRAETLAAGLRASGTILVVVGTADPDRFWSDLAAETGGFFAPAGNPVVVPALDQVQTTLRSRYLIRFPTPSQLPARVGVQVRTTDLTFTSDATVPLPTVEESTEDSRWPAIAWAAGIVAVLVVLAVLLIKLGRRPDKAPPTIARGRASVPRRDPNL
nr:VWA domain-containing protein [uncultured Actinoplanes sp.]